MRYINIGAEMRIKMRKSLLILGTVIGLVGLTLPSFAQFCSGKTASACCCENMETPCQAQFAPSSCCQLSREQGERKNALPSSNFAPVFHFELATVTPKFQDPQIFLSPIHQVDATASQPGRYLTLKSLLC